MRTISFYVSLPYSPVLIMIPNEEVPFEKPSGARSLSRKSYILSVSIILIALLSFSSCKKNNTVVAAFPVLGTCKAVAVTGSLSYSAANSAYAYNTKGGGKILITGSLHIKFSHKDYENFTVEWWGGLTVGGQNRLSANHENLNGKHIKDRVGSVRSFIFPDGTKLTLKTDGETGQILTISIYEAEVSHHINYVCNTVEYSGVDQSVAQKLDQSEPDGETATIEITATGLLYLNIYNEPTVGGKVEQRLPLGELNRSQPNMVRDYYDDLRLGHT